MIIGRGENRQISEIDAALHVSVSRVGHRVITFYDYVVRSDQIQNRRANR